MKRYDDAASNLHNALSEQQEIDRRANEVGAQLVKNMDLLAQVKVDVKDLERKRSKQERLLKDINQVGSGMCHAFVVEQRLLFCLNSLKGGQGCLMSSHCLESLLKDINQVRLGICHVFVVERRLLFCLNFVGLECTLWNSLLQLLVGTLSVKKGYM